MRAVKVESDGKGTGRVMLSNGSELHGIRRVEWSMTAGDAAIVRLEILLHAATVEGRPVFYAVHPLTGHSVDVQALVAADGSVIELGRL